VFPNPATDQLVIDLSDNINLSEPVLGTLVNMNGQTVHSFTLQQDNTQLDVSGLPSGIYVLRVMEGNVKVFVQ